MADTENVVETVRSRYDVLTNSQKRIAEAIVEDPEFVAFATVDKLAARLDVAASTIVRFAYKIGLEGYQDLQERVRVQVRQQYRDSTDREDGSPASHLLGTPYGESLAHDLDNLQRTILGLDAELLERVIEAIAGANRVYVCGELTSYSLAYFTAIALGRARDGVRLVRADAQGSAALVDVGDGDVVVAYSFPPYSKNVLRVIEWAHSQGAFTIGVADGAFSPVGQRVDLVVSVLASGVGPQNTLVPGLAVANAVVNGLVMRDEERALERYAAVVRLANEWDLFVLGPNDNG